MGPRVSDLRIVGLGFASWGVELRFVEVGLRITGVGFRTLGLTYESLGSKPQTPRVQVPNNHILTQHLYYSYYCPNPRYVLNYWVHGPSGKTLTRVGLVRGVSVPTGNCYLSCTDMSWLTWRVRGT